MSVTQLEKTPTSTPTHDSLNAATTRSQSELEDDFGLGTPASTVHVPQDREIDSNNNNDAADDDEVDNKKLEYIEKEIPESIPIPQDIYPDGGLRAWLVVFGAICNTFATFGFLNSWGTFQAHYTQTILKDESPSNIAWIGSIQYALIFLPGILVGRLFDLGYFSSVFLISSTILIIATFLVAQCTQYWHFLLCQGIVIGLSAGAIFGPTLTVVGQWFKKRRGLAMGWVAIGSSLGGTILPIAAKNLIIAVGFPWTMRIIGFILLVVLGCANLTMRRRLEPMKTSGGMLNLKAFKNAAFTIYCISALICFLGIYTVLTYVSISAIELGISDSLAFYLLSVANAASLFGRLTSGALSDRCGAGNVIIPFTAIAGILTYVWPFARTQSALIAVIVLYGYSSGAYVSLMVNPIMELGAPHDLGRRIGMFMSIFSFGALAGPPISGAINTATGGFKDVGYYAGSMVLLAVILMCITRHLVLGKLWGRF